MPISALDAAYQAMRKGPGNPAAATAFAQQANQAEGDVKTADAAYVAAQKAYDKALAEFVKAALEAGLDR